MTCPDKASWRVRKPEFIEQLIPPFLKTHHQISTQTLVQKASDIPISCPYDPVIEIPEDKDGKFIRATLASHNLPSSGKIENKRVLEAFFALTGKKVVYLQNEKDIAEKQAKKSTKKEKVVCKYKKAA